MHPPLCALGSAFDVHDVLVALAHELFDDEELHRHPQLVHTHRLLRALAPPTPTHHIGQRGHLHAGPRIGELAPPLVVEGEGGG